MEEETFHFSPIIMDHKPGFLSLLFIFIFLFLFLTNHPQLTNSKCNKGCEALASYYVSEGLNLSFIIQVMTSSLLKLNDAGFTTLLSYNPTISNKDNVKAGTRVDVPFPCDCLYEEFLGHVFQYSVRIGNTYDVVANVYYANLTTVSWLKTFNSYPANNIPDTATLNVTVNCSCGNAKVNENYGLFVTYPLRPGESLESVATQANVTPSVLQSYNVGVNFSAGSGLVYVPGKDANSSFRPLTSSKDGLGAGAIAGITIAAVVVVFILASCGYVRIYPKKKVFSTAHDTSAEAGHAPVGDSDKPVDTTGSAPSPGLTCITVDKSVEFSYEELAKATNDFSLAKKIGEGGYGSVYYAELRGEKAAIKKMDKQASKEFLAELKVLTHVHHLNLVRLIGYCVKGSLFLVYEYIENGNLSQHLRGADGREPLPWSTRVQVALDSARGLEYIHEHTVPVYIHRDIKSANILIDGKFQGKVADFGLTKLTKVGSASLPTGLVGTFGYMPPEYANCGDVSPKVDVYAFGVVLYELISAKDAIIKTNGSVAEARGLVALFEDVLDQLDSKEDLRKLVDPRLGEDYPLDSVMKVAQLARACTQENPQLRPSMRSIVVALTILSSTTEDWDVGTFYENQALVNLMSGR